VRGRDAAPTAGLADTIAGKPSNVSARAYSVDDPDDPDAAVAIEVSGPAAL
jgi:hypothetical protein